MVRSSLGASARGSRARKRGLPRTLLCAAAREGGDEATLAWTQRRAGEPADVESPLALWLPSAAGARASEQRRPAYGQLACTPVRMAAPCQQAASKVGIAVLSREAANRLVPRVVELLLRARSSWQARQAGVTGSSPVPPISERPRCGVERHRPMWDDRERQPTRSLPECIGCSQRLVQNGQTVGRVAVADVERWRDMDAVAQDQR